MRTSIALTSLLLILLLTGCKSPATPTPLAATPTEEATIPVEPSPLPATATTAPVATEVTLPVLSITLGTLNETNGITLDQGGDVDTRVVKKGGNEARQTGNGLALPATDGNTTPDGYIQFNVQDDLLSGGRPSAHVRVEVDYFDEGSDSFLLEYDARSGTFAGGGLVTKGNSFTNKTAAFNLCDAYFMNRDNGADFRLSDNFDGAESIFAVRVIILPEAGAQTIQVDDFGADPFDDQPDSAAIQAALDSTCDQDTVVFTSGVESPGYQGYWIDQTLFLTGSAAKQGLILTASDPANHAQWRATADLKGFVARLFARSRINNPGMIDDIEISSIDMHGGRELRQCQGADGVSNGLDDNYGSWLPECPAIDDPWCLPGVLGLDGGGNWADTSQNYLGRPDEWSTNVVVHDLRIEQGECGTALAFFSAGGRIENVTIDTAGDHVHAAGCAFTDADGDVGAWSDGITLFGPGHTITGNTVVNPSDIGIVFFGGKDTAISNNTIKITAGNYGAFGGIALHPWIFGDIGGLQINGNTVVSEGDPRCGGLHTGINLGTHMWGGACLNEAGPALFGNPGACKLEPLMEEVRACTGGRCQVWAYIPEGSTASLQDNSVTGAHINYLIEGLAIFGEFIDAKNTSSAPQRSDWQAARDGCEGLRWGPLDKVAHHPALDGYLDMVVHCER